MVGAAVSYVPAIWVVAGVAVALFGLLPRLATTVAWTAVGLFLLITMFAESFEWPGWVVDLSPISWIPAMPLTLRRSSRAVERLGSNATTVPPGLTRRLARSVKNP